MPYVHIWAIPSNVKKIANETFSYVAHGCLQSYYKVELVLLGKETDIVPNDESIQKFV